jgi:hypothetical protein
MVRHLKDPKEHPDEPAMFTNAGSPVKSHGKVKRQSHRGKKKPKRQASLAQRLNPTPDTSTKLLSNGVLSPGHLIN